ncbi:hypothetical protein QYM36_011117 [Artemia franciscana]|uniref:F-box domain-containing protein n=1 Tax=Artemia franciscana TaxID=6661 RepID=A0AA88L462_ARTSF|nr:hypothetical protein QYM36_011117 [Artemia franciscana]
MGFLLTLKSSGGFTCVDDLKKIRGFSSRLYDLNRTKLFVTPLVPKRGKLRQREKSRQSSRIQVSQITPDGTPVPRQRRLLPRAKTKSNSEEESDSSTILEENTSIDLSCRGTKRRIEYGCQSALCEKKLCSTAKKSASSRKEIQDHLGRIQPPPSAHALHDRIPTKKHPPPELDGWLTVFQRWTNAERLMALDRLIDGCEATQVRHLMSVIEPQFQRDFISLLPKELALYVLSFLEPRDLSRAAQTCRYWRILAEDNLLWREKCKEIGIEDLYEMQSRRRKLRTGSTLTTTRSLHDSGSPRPPSPSPWKLAYLYQQNIELNWRSRPLPNPRVLKGHDDHVITCLQFNGSRIVSGSDDNTLKIWSAIDGKCLKTLTGHTGGVWSSQMSDTVVVSGSTDRTLKVWNINTGHCIHTLYGHTSTVRCLHMHGNKVVSGSRDAMLRVWDVTTGECLHVLVGHVAAVRCVQYDGRLVVSGAYDFTVKVWDPEREECLHTLSGHTNRVYSLQVQINISQLLLVFNLIGNLSLLRPMMEQLSYGISKQVTNFICQCKLRSFTDLSLDNSVLKWRREFVRNLVTLESGGSGGVVWRIKTSDIKLVCAVGSRNGTEETKLMVLDFDAEK